MASVKLFSDNDTLKTLYSPKLSLRYDEGQYDYIKFNDVISENSYMMDRIGKVRKFLQTGRDLICYRAEIYDPDTLTNGPKMTMYILNNGVLVPKDSGIPTEVISLETYVCMTMEDIYQSAKSYIK